MIEEELIAGCRQKNEKAFEILYNQYAGLLYGIAIRYASNNKEAEDVLQDTFIKVFQNIDSYTNSGSFIGWIKRILVNTAINSYRNAYNRNIETKEEIYSFPLYDENDVFDNLAEEDLLKILDRLPDGYKMVFNLYVIEGYKHHEIAEILNITEGTSKSQLSKARKLLQSMIKKTGIEVLQG